MNESDKIKVLLVNDVQAEIFYYKHSNKRLDESYIEVIGYGPDDSSNPSNVGVGFIDDIKSGKLPRESFDVVFVDYALGVMNGIELIKFIDEELYEYKIPVVLMTKNDGDMIRKAINALEIGARGYVLTKKFNENKYENNNDSETVLAIKDIEMTAVRVYKEYQREKWSEALMEISTQLPLVDNEKGLCELVIKVLSDRNKELKVFIRIFDETNGRVELKLVSATHNIPNSVQSDLFCIDPKGFYMLEKAIKEGVTVRYNDFGEIRHGISIEAHDICVSLELERGMTFPLKDQDGNVFGTVSMYRRMIDPAFSKVEEEYAELMINCISLTWKARQQRQKGEAFNEFINKLSLEIDENELYSKLLKHLHEKINNGYVHDENSKATFKVLKPGTDYLFCDQKYKHHYGAKRDNSWMPSIFGDNSISAYVARNNTPKIVKDYKNEALYHSTNSNMQSELCVPLAIGEKRTDKVYGVINLESNKKDFYDEYHKDYAHTLCTLLGKSIERIRIERFLKDMLEMMVSDDHPTVKISRCVNIIKEMTGYQILVFVLKKDDQWSVAEVDIPKVKYKYEFSDIIEKKMNGNDVMLIKKAIEDGNDVCYINDLNLLREAGWIPDSKYISESIQRSQSVFLMKVNNEIYGALSLDFAVANPLTKNMIFVLRYLSRWMATLFMGTQKYKELHDKYESASEDARVSHILSILFHKTKGKLESVSLILDSLMRRSNEIQSRRDYQGDLMKINESIEEVYALIKRYKAIDIAPCIQRVNVNELCSTTINELKCKAELLSVKIVYEALVINEMMNIDYSRVDFCLYNAIDNSLDACKKVNNGKVVVRLDNSHSKYFIISVIDNGIGITECVEKAKEPGYTTKSDGTGYGVTFSDKLIQGIGGKYDIYKNIDDKGVTVQIKIPKI